MMESKLMQNYIVLWGDFKDPCQFETQAVSVELAKVNFRKEFGYNHIRIVGVEQAPNTFKESTYNELLNAGLATLAEEYKNDHKGGN